MHLWLKCFIVMVFFAENILDRVVKTGKPGSQTSDAMCGDDRGLIDKGRGKFTYLKNFSIK